MEINHTPPSMYHQRHPPAQDGPSFYVAASPRHAEPTGTVHRIIPLSNVPNFPVDDVNKLFTMTSLGTPLSPPATVFPPNLQYSLPMLEDTYSKSSLFSRFYDQFRPVFEINGESFTRISPGYTDGKEGKTAAAGPSHKGDSDVECMLRHQQKKLFESMDRRIQEMQMKRQVAERAQLERRADYERRELYERQALQRDEQRNFHDLQMQILDLLMNKFRAKAVDKACFHDADSYVTLTPSPSAHQPTPSFTHGPELHPNL